MITIGQIPQLPFVTVKTKDPTIMVVLILLSFALVLWLNVWCCGFMADKWGTFFHRELHYQVWMGVAITFVPFVNKVIVPLTILTAIFMALL